MGSIQSTPTVVGGSVAASLVVGALFYSAQNQEPVAEEQPQPSSSSKKSKKKKKSPTSPLADDAPAEKGTITPPALAQSTNLFAAPQPQQLHDSLLSVESAKSKNKKKNKAKSGATATGDASAAESGVESSAGDAAVSGGQSGSESTKAKKKKKSKAKSPLGQSANLGASVQGVDASTMLDASIMDQNGLGPWTHVQTRRGKPAPITAQVPPSVSDKHAVESSDAGITTSVTEESQDQDDDNTQDGSESADAPPAKKPDNVRTLAEKMLPKPRKTGVDDMLETSDFPSVARVMRVTSGNSSDAPPQKASGVSWGDYEDADQLADGDAGDDEGWDIVTSRKPNAARSASQHDPLTSSMTSSTSSIPGAPQKLTKHQKQNVARRESQKQAKAEAEADRLERLAKHKRELEKARIEEQYKKSSKTKVGGGMSSSVQNGALVWE